MGLSLGFFTEDQLGEALAEQWNTTFVTLYDRTIPPEVLKLVSEPMAQLYRVIPIQLSGNRLTVATAEPQKIQIADELRTFLGYDIHNCVATEQEIQKAIDKFYSAENESVESIVESLENDKELAAQAAGLGGEGPTDLTSVEALAESAPVRKLLNMVLLLAIRDGASDIHFEPFETEFRIRLKADGVLQEMVPPPKHLAFAITTSPSGGSRRTAASSSTSAAIRSISASASSPRSSARASSCGCSIGAWCRSTSTRSECRRRRSAASAR